MSENIIGAAELALAVEAFRKQLQLKLMDLFEGAQQATYDDSQAHVPTLTGNLKERAFISMSSGPNGEMQFDVTYGEIGQSYGSKYGMEDGGYAWFVELGHMTRDGATMVPPNPYLGPAFDKVCKALEDSLQEMIDRL
jgi:hypothetical protein